MKFYKALSTLIKFSIKIRAFFEKFVSSLTPQLLFSFFTPIRVKQKIKCQLNFMLVDHYEVNDRIKSLKL